jgi:hypothetical protein
MESKRKLTKNYADIENNKNILFCTGIFWVGQMHYGPPKEIFGWAMAHPKYRVAPPVEKLVHVPVETFPLNDYTVHTSHCAGAVSSFARCRYFPLIIVVEYLAIFFSSNIALSVHSQQLYS